MIFLLLFIFPLVIMGGLAAYLAIGNNKKPVSSLQ